MIRADVFEALCLPTLFACRRTAGTDKWDPVKVGVTKCMYPQLMTMYQASKTDKELNTQLSESEVSAPKSKAKLIRAYVFKLVIRLNSRA